jgi:hypothetical protein
MVMSFDEWYESQSLASGCPIWPSQHDAAKAAWEAVVNQRMTTEQPAAPADPVAHIVLDDNKTSIPVYTHPLRELSKTEIYDIWLKTVDAGEMFPLVFARAVIAASREGKS